MKSARRARRLIVDWSGSVGGRAAGFQFLASQAQQTGRSCNEPDSGRRVTVVDFLSPSNKLPGDGRRKYERQRSELGAAEISLLEIDLVRTGPTLLNLPKPGLPSNARIEYYVCLRRSRAPQRAYVWPISIRNRLPTVPIPQGFADNDVSLDLQALLEQAYQNAGTIALITASRVSRPLRVKTRRGPMSSFARRR
jgi:hypothetical protein